MVPVYRQVVDIVRSRIESGELRPNRPVPGINALMQEFGVARNTAIKALKTLKEEGLVSRVPGKGTFVKST